MVWKDIGDFAFYAATVAALLFAVLYLFLAPWWKTGTGRNIMSIMGLLAVAFAYFSWAIWQGGVPDSFHPARAMIFSAFAATIMWRTILFIRVHLMRKPKEGKENELENAR